MKRIFTLMMAICLVAGMATAQESNGKPQRPNGEQMTKMKIKKMVKYVVTDADIGHRAGKYSKIRAESSTHQHCAILGTFLRKLTQLQQLCAI